jgi:hypothetical protein
MSGWTCCEHCGEGYDERKEGHSCWQSEVAELRERVEKLEKVAGYVKAMEGVWSSK